MFRAVSKTAAVLMSVCIGLGTIANPVMAKSQSEETDSSGTESDQKPVLPIKPISDQSDKPIKELETLDEFSGKHGYPEITFDTVTIGSIEFNVISEEGSLPAGTELSITPVYESGIFDAVSEIADDYENLTAIDISFIFEGNEIEPAGNVIVSLSASDQEINEDYDYQVIHIDDEMSADILPSDSVEVVDNTITFVNNQFSVYVIIGTAVITEPSGSLTFNGDGYSVIVSYSEESGIPAGTELTVSEIDSSSSLYEDLYTQIEDTINPEIQKEDYDSEADWQLDRLFHADKEISDVRILDITLMYNGEEIEPQQPVNVEIRYDEPMHMDSSSDDSLTGAQVIHFAETDDEITPELISDVKTETNADGDVEAFIYEQDGFSSVATILYGQPYGIGTGAAIPYFFPNSSRTDNKLYFRYTANGLFELGAWSNGNLVWPGDAGFPSAFSSICQFDAGTTIMEILESLYTPNAAIHGDNRHNWYDFFCRTGGVEFQMYKTYTITEANHQYNMIHLPGLTYTELGVSTSFDTSSSEWWRSYHIWYKPNTSGGWDQEWVLPTVTIKRGNGFEDVLVDVKTPQDRNVNLFTNVIIDNCSSNVPAVKQISDGANDAIRGNITPVALSVTEPTSLVRMEMGSRITDSTPKSPYVGTGVILDNGGSFELFRLSTIEKMAVAVDQINGKTHLKTSVDGFNDNTIGVALSYGQSVGKWKPDISGTNPVPIWLRDVSQWRSGDVVLESGEDNVGPNGGHVPNFDTPVFPSDLNQVSLQNSAQLATSMGLEYYAGPTPAGPRYPVIRFIVGTVLNTRTGTWYPTLYDAVNLLNPVGIAQNNANNNIQDDDTLVFYGSTNENHDIAINYDLDIRSSFTNELSNDNRSGNDCSAFMNGNYTITVAAGKTLTIGGNQTTGQSGTGTVTGTAGKLTIDGNSVSDNIITNNGTLGFKANSLIANAVQNGIWQNGTFFLGGGDFNGNTNDVYLCSTAIYQIPSIGMEDVTNHVIWLDAKGANTSEVKIELGNSGANLYDLRNVVCTGLTSPLSGEQTTYFKLGSATQALLAQYHLSYVYTASDDVWHTPVLELQQADSFYIYHSSDNTVEKVFMDDSRIVNNQFNITAEVRADYLYGGYYSNYKNKGSGFNPASLAYTIDQNGRFFAADTGSGASAYSGGMGIWKSSEASKSSSGRACGIGTALDVYAGNVYYLKEVPDYYLKPYLAVVFKTNDNNRVIGNYLISALDDNNYGNYGLIKSGNTQEDVDKLTKYKLATKLSVTTSSGTVNYDVPTVTGTSGAKGYVAVWKYDPAIDHDYIYTPAFVTPDGVVVEGDKVRSVNIGTGVYKGIYTGTLTGGEGYRYSDTDNLVGTNITAIGNVSVRRPNGVIVVNN